MLNVVKPKDSVGVSGTIPLTSNIIKQKWLGMNEKDLLDTIRDTIEKDKPNIKKILTANISFRDKCMAIEKLDVLEKTNPYTMEYISLKMQINKMLCNDYINEDLEDELERLSKKRDSLKSRLFESGLGQKNMITAYNKYIYLMSLDPSTQEYTRLKEWFEWLLSIPHKKSETKLLTLNDPRNLTIRQRKNINKYLLNIREHLDKHQYGNNKAKNELLSYICNRITNDIGNIIAFVGPPGIGKTSLIKAFSEAIKIPVYHISMGTANDKTFFTGHKITYENSLPGMIIKALKEMGCNNGIIYMDEFDKLDSELMNELLHIIDPVQNSEFRDDYLDDIVVDISNILFICSLNNKDKLSDALLSRIPIVTIDPYTQKEKFEIAKNHLIPKAIDKVGMHKKDIIISDEIIEYIIKRSEQVNQEQGVRKLKQDIESMFLKINIQRCCIHSNNPDTDLSKFNFDFKIKDFKLPLSITTNIIDQLFEQINTPFNNMMYV